MKILSAHAALLYGPNDLRIEKVNIHPPAKGEVLVKIAAATTCGTDHKTFKRGGHPMIMKQLPSPFGHEMAGAIVEIGDGVENFQIGDRVVVANSAPCLECFFCRKNEPNLCENIYFVNGAFAEYLTVPAPIVRSNLHKIPDHLDFASASLTEPLACVVHACEITGIKKDDTVAIVGTGPMSVFFTQIIRTLGGKVIIIGRNHEKLAMLKNLGANHLINIHQHDPVAAVKDITCGYGADVGIEAVGLPDTWEQTVNLVRKGGRVCLYGGCAKGTVFPIDTFRLHYEEISLHGVFHHTPQTLKKAIILLASGEVKAEVFLREERLLTDLPQIFAGHDPAQPLKFLIRPNRENFPR